MTAVTTVPDCRYHLPIKQEAARQRQPLSGCTRIGPKESSMSLLRALRAYVGLGPDEDYENLYRDHYGDRPDIDRPARDRGTTREFAQSGAVATGRGGSRGRRSQGKVDHGVTNRSKTSPRPRAPGADDLRVPDGESAGPPEVDSGSNVHATTSDSSSTSTFADQSTRGDAHGAGGTGSGTSESAGDEPETNEQGAVVRSIDSVRTRPKTVAPESFADAKNIGDDFKLGTPIVLNLQGLDRDLARRLIDFASGVCYALDGSMEKLATQVFLLTPEGIEVSESDRLRIEQRGYAR
jgi:FtsZ-interacting cell division protein YlmF